MAQAAEASSETPNCVAALIYVYDHAQRDLPKKLVDNAHHHHELSLATLHVHLDEANCMEVTALRGKSSEVRHFADHVIAARGVRYGRVVMIPTSADGGKKKPHKHR